MEEFDNDRANAASIAHAAGAACASPTHDSDHVSQPRMILASQSPRRRELLAQEGVSFACLVPHVDERSVTAEDAESLAIATASLKARAAFDMLPKEAHACPIVACDTLVVTEDDSKNEIVLGKPSDAAEARDMLHMLSGRTHRVISGVCIMGGRMRQFGHRDQHGLLRHGAQIGQLCFAETTRVTFRELTDRQIDEYISTSEPFDKAGAYGIQGAAGAFVEKVEGDYDNVVGLPLAKTMEVLETMDMQSVGKAEVRAQMKAVRKSIGADERAAASEQTCKNLMQTPEFERARVIAAYCAFGSELAFDYMAQNLPEEKVFAVPITMANHRMEFVVIDPLQVLPQNRTLPFLADPAKMADIPEDAEVLEASQIDLMLVPGLAFDDSGYRIGYGGGYYDVYMKRDGFRADRMGTYFEQQHYTGSLPHDSNDVPLPAVVTQNGVRRFV